MSTPQAALHYAKTHQAQSLEDLKSLVRIPSISTLPERQSDIKAAAEWVAAKLRSMGLDRVEILPTGGHPLVCAEWLRAGPSAPTLLVYGHYDVQPVDPVELWDSDPFEPAIKGENLFARGASDMKAQLVAHLGAVEAMLATTGLPVNLKYLLEGEEEIGSPHLESFIRTNEARLACDLCLNPDSIILAPDTPSVTYTLRGLAYFEIRVQGARADLHSGQYGGAVDNPAMALARVLADMKDAQGRITLPGFYDKVRPLTEEERRELAALPQTDQWWLEQTGVKALGGEAGYTALERATARPTLDINGLLSGSTGQGSKTVLPARAMAKISMRLVPDQKPQEVERSLRAYLEAHMPPTVTWEVEYLAGSLPAIVERDSRGVQAASRALEGVWGKPIRFTRQGGTIPVVAVMQSVLGVDSLMMGFGLPDDNLHAPNEHLPTFYRGIEAFIRFTYEVAAH